MSAEQNMLNNLQKKYATYPNTKILSYNSLSHTYPDFLFEGLIGAKNYTFYLEAKIENSHNNPNYAKQLFAEILMNKNPNVSKSVNKLTTNSFPIEYGILLSFNNCKTDKVHQFLIDHIDSNDWDNFGTNFGVRYIFLFDDINTVLYYTSWKGFLKSKAVSTYAKY